MAARVASQANGGETGVQRVEGAVSWLGRLVGLRTVSLKGLSGEHEIWAVEWSDSGPARCWRDLDRGSWVRPDGRL